MSYLEQTNTRKPLGEIKSIFCWAGLLPCWKWRWTDYSRMFQVVRKPRGCCGSPSAFIYSGASKLDFLQAWAQGRLTACSTRLGKALGYHMHKVCTDKYIHNWEKEKKKRPPKSPLSHSHYRHSHQQSGLNETQGKDLGPGMDYAF